MSEIEQAENIVGQIHEIQERGHDGWVFTDAATFPICYNTNLGLIENYNDMVCITINGINMPVRSITRIIEETRTGDIAYQIK